jgi:RPA family protein
MFIKHPNISNKTLDKNQDVIEKNIAISSSGRPVKRFTLLGDVVNKHGQTKLSTVRCLISKDRQN